MQAIWNGKIIGESSDTVVVEGNHYFPIAAIQADYLEKSATTSVCPWKGTAHYYNLVVDGKTNADAGWYYPSPKAAASEIENRVAFWRGVEISE